MNVLEKWKSPALFNCFRSTAKKKGAERSKYYNSAA